MREKIRKDRNGWTEGMAFTILPKTVLQFANETKPQALDLQHVYIVIYCCEVYASEVF